MQALSSALLSALVSSGVIVAILGIVFQRRTKEMEAQIKLRIDQALATANSQRAWSELYT